jgi:hypothetical protein
MAGCCYIISASCNSAIIVLRYLLFNNLNILK